MQEEEKTEEPTQSTFLDFQAFLGQIDITFVEDFITDFTHFCKKVRKSYLFSQKVYFL